MGFIFAIMEWLVELANMVNRIKYFIYPIVMLYTENKILEQFHKLFSKKANKY